MNLENIKFDITRLFKPDEEKQYFILEVPGSGKLVIPESRIRELPTGLKRKFFMQQGISFRVLMTALNIWIMEKDNDHKSNGTVAADSKASQKEKTKDSPSSGKVINPEMEDQKGGPGNLGKEKKSPIWKGLKEK